MILFSIFFNFINTFFDLLEFALDFEIDIFEPLLRLTPKSKKKKPSLGPSLGLGR